MKTKREYKPELCVSKDFARPNLQHVFLDTNNKKLVATDGQRMCILPCSTEETDTSGHIPSEALKEARKSAKAYKNPDLTISANGSAQVENNSYARPDKGPFPPWQRVEPKFKEGDKGTTSICLNANLLASLTEALGSKSGIVTLTFQDPEELGPILVNPSGDQEAYGVLMPCKG